MRISPMPQVCTGLLSGSLLFAAGCGNPQSASLASLTVTASPSSLSVGGASVLHATAHLSDGTTQDVSGGTQWTVSDTNLASLSNGALTAKAAGTVVVQAAYVEVAPAGNSPAASTASPTTLNASAKVTITAAGTTNVPSITWNAPSSIVYGTALGATQLNASADVGGTFTYSPAAGTVLKAGQQTLSLTFTPSDSKTYSAGTASVALQVNQATPVLNWAAPAAISFGTPLGVAQLNASANVPGAFLYSPAAGTVPAAGTQSLSAVFTPTDAVDYASGRVTTTITVTSASNPTPTPPTPTPPTPAPPPAPAPAPVLPTPISCGGPTIDLNPSMSQAVLQSSIKNAPTCSLIRFAAGTYTLSSHLAIPCSNLQIAGPVAATPTALLAATYTNDSIFDYDGNCAKLGSVMYLHFANTGGVYVRTGNNSNFVVKYNLMTNLPALTSTSGGIYSTSESGVFLDGGLSNKTDQVDIEYNTFGDANSCAATFPLATDEGGSCAGVLTHTGDLEHLNISHNKFIHVEEGIHLEQLTTQYAIGNPNGVCVSCVIDYNYIVNYHRIGVEIQISTPVDSIMFEHNSIVDPVNSSWGTFATSFACCTAGAIQGFVGYSPALIVNDNVLVSTLPIGNSGWGPPMGVEFWGTGAIGENNLVQGTFLNGFSYGYGEGGWQINNNYICGGVMATYKTFVSNEEHQPQAPSQAGNVTGATCSATASKAPVISPAGGSFTGSQTITLSNPGANTGIWYTTDGSTPVPGSGTARYYTGPFAISNTATVNVVGMWGSIEQPVSYPAGYGYVPSSVVSAHFVAGAVVKAPGAQRQAGSGNEVNSPSSVIAPVTVAITPALPAVVIGGSAQVKAVATFSDGSTKDVTTAFAWHSSDVRTVAVSASGAVSGLASGQAIISGSYGPLHAAVPVASTLGVTNWSKPVVITQGGIYTGDWQSTDGKTAAVTIATDAPVIIENAHISGTANLIEVNTTGAQVTVRNSVAVALRVTSKGRPNGVFLDISSPARLDVESNYLENVREGVVIHGYSGSRTARETLIIKGNRVRNINGMLSDGMQGYLPGSAGNATTARFVALDNVQSVPGVEVAWNEVVNYPTRSLVSDLIHIYRSSGTINHPLDIHDTYIQGAYPPNSAQDAYRGGGIKTDGSTDDGADAGSAFTSIHDNQVVGTAGYGIAFAAGHDNLAADNRVISSGLLPDGTKITAQRVGLSNTDVHGGSRGSTYNNAMHDNVVGWGCWTAACRETGYRRDQYFPAAPQDYDSNSLVPAQAITLEMEENEYQLWSIKTATAGIQVGPVF